MRCYCPPLTMRTSQQRVAAGTGCNQNERRSQVELYPLALGKRWEERQLILKFHSPLFLEDSLQDGLSYGLVNVVNFLLSAGAHQWALQAGQRQQWLQRLVPFLFDCAFRMEKLHRSVAQGWCKSQHCLHALDYRLEERGWPWDCRNAPSIRSRSHARVGFGRDTINPCSYNSKYRLDLWHGNGLACFTSNLHPR